MSRRTLEDLKRYIKEQENKKSSYDNNRSRDVYPFWNMEDGQYAIIRLLEDANQDNPNIFFVERFTHTLSIGGKDRTIPCLTQYGEKCPICALSKAYYAQEGKHSKNGKYYYRKKSAIVRILVLEDPLPPDPETGETFKGKVVKTYIGNQLLKKMLAQLTDDIDPMSSIPWDIENGNNFIIRKDRDGDYPVYDLNSKFINTVTPIPKEYRHLVEEPVDLRTYLPPNPGLEKVEKLLLAHQTGEDFNEDDDENFSSENNSYENSTSYKVEANKKQVQKETELTESKSIEVKSDNIVVENDAIARIRDRFKKK
jgi:hypothetical protein